MDLLSQPLWKRATGTVPIALLTCKRTCFPISNPYDAEVAAQIPAQSHTGQPEAQMSRQAAGGKFETCLSSRSEVHMLS